MIKELIEDGERNDKDLQSKTFTVAIERAEEHIETNLQEYLEKGLVK